MDESTIICQKCNKEMQKEMAEFSYLGNKFQAEMLVCPVCRQVFVPETIAQNRMMQVERLLESK